MQVKPTAIGATRSRDAPIIRISIIISQTNVQCVLIKSQLYRVSRKSIMEPTLAELRTHKENQSAIPST